MPQEQKIKIAVDCMGGDYGPEEVISGIKHVVAEDSNIDFVLCGNYNRISTLVDRLDVGNSVSAILNADHVVDASAKWQEVIRGSDRFSMGIAVNCVSENTADAVVSGGHTGAYVALCVDKLHVTPSISRAILAGFIPTITGGRSVLLDAGATLRADAAQLTQFALMGVEVARNLLGISNPRIGILNIGSEDDKGPEELKLAAANISKIYNQKCHFIEADQLTTGDVDVIVTDGFTGNIAIKSAEGTLKTMLKIIKETAVSSLKMKFAGLFAKPLLRKALERFDASRYNGGLWLGLNKGVVIKSHGNSRAFGIAQAIKLAAVTARSKCIDSIRNAIIAYQKSPCEL